MKRCLALLLSIGLLISVTSYAIRFDPTKIVNAVSMATSVNSTVLDLDQYVGCSVQAVWSGAPDGSIKLQISNDIADSGSSVVNWDDYTGSSQTVLGAGSFSWNLTQANYRWLRVVYTRSAGTGALTVIAGRKM